MNNYFVGTIIANGCNPNGDINTENRPRIDDLTGRGFITDVCIKHKIRTRLKEMGYEVFDSVPEFDGDSLSARFKETISNLSKEEQKDSNAVCNALLSRYIDVRLFGATCAFDKTSVGITGAVTFMPTYSIAPIDIVDVGITKCINSKSIEGGSKSSDTIGSKSFVRHGLYKLQGTITSFSAQKNEVSEEDINALKTAIMTLFDNDASAARPAGSMYVDTLYWMTSSSVHPHTAHNSVKISYDDTTVPCSINDYNISLDIISNLDVEELHVD